MRLFSACLSLSFLFLFSLSTAHAQEDDVPDVNLGAGDNEQLVQELWEKVVDLQVKKDKEFFPFVTFKQRKGSYESDIKLNFHGNALKSLPRTMSCYDNNAFVPAWITIMLLESKIYGKGIKTETDNWDPIVSALDLLKAFTDHNLPQGEGIYAFWPQVLNKSNGVWHPQPDNLSHLFDIPNAFNAIPDSVLDMLFRIPGIGKVIKTVKKAIEDGPESPANAFRVTPDFDDSFVSLGMGALMRQFKSKFENEFGVWQGDNAHVEKAFEYLVRYAYRPWSKEIDHNLIDPRTFYWIKDYLWGLEGSLGHLRGDTTKSGLKSGSGLETFMLPTTWVSNHTMDMYYSQRGVHMPLHVQNIDVTVVSNVLSGITLSLLADPTAEGSEGETMSEMLCKDPSKATDPSLLPSFFSSEVQQLYSNTIDLFVWLMGDPSANSVLFKRRDLTMLYYPSIYNFMWMASRSYFQLNSHLHSECALPPLLHTAHTKLHPLFTETLTQWLMKEMQTQNAGQHTVAFWDDFLGNGDEKHGQPNEKHQDRLFSTAQAMNVLLNVWGVWDKQKGSFRMLEATPKHVLRALEQSARWLRTYITPNTPDHSKKFAPLNTFFSGSARGPSSLTFVHPSNYARHINGTRFDPPHEGKFGPETGAMFCSSFGITGVVGRSEYSKMLEQTWFGQKTATEFAGFNSPDAQGWPFWSAPALTYSAALLALSRYGVVEGGESVGGLRVSDNVLFE
eukprot:GDKI01005145.1.p1 GENE.GDKI01005145.1~~GDKI01005145.1.p1  ORF type:complete len:730 (-),score=208.05 GDKI01005145.1:132-2321(-)